MECESTALPELRKVSLSAAEFAARMAVALQDVNKMQYIAYENEQGELYFPAPSPTYQVGTMDSAGRLRLGSATGQVPAEAAATDALLVTQVTRQLQTQINTGIGGLLFGGTPSSTVAAGNAQHIIGPTGAIVLAAGVLNNHQLAPPVVGYHACIELVSIMSDTADTYTFTFQDSNDVAVDIGELTQATAIIVAAPNVSYPLYGLRGHNTTISLAGEVDVAGGGGIEEIYLGYNIWYELP